MVYSTVMYHAVKVWDTTRNDVGKLAYKTPRKKSLKRSGKSSEQRVRKIVRKIGNKGWAERVVQDSKAKRQSKDVHQVRVIKSNNGEILVEETKVKQRWKDYFKKL